MTTEAAWAFAERIAKDIAAQDRQLISSRAMSMIAAEFDAATLHPTAREVATAALVAAALADVATWAKVVELTEEDQELAAQMRPSRPGSDVELTDACRAHDAAAGAYRDAVLAYLATVTP